MASRANIGFSCSNEELFIGLDKITNGSPLPSNVISDVNPYKYEPQNLPDDIWFLSSSKDHTDIEHGLWKTREEPLQVFSNSDIIGWRTTLEYYNDGRKTNWVMQLFSTTQKRLCDENAKKESICLSRVFLVPGNEMQRNVSTARLLPEPPVLDANCSATIGSSSNPQVNKHDEAEVLGVAERLPEPEHQGENIVEMDIFNSFSGGDFLELKDLENPASSSSSDNSSASDFLELKDLDNPASSSSSDNSSAASISSDECFDSMAFLQDLDRDQVLEHNDTGKKLNVSASNRVEEVVVVPATLGSLVSIGGSNSASGSRNLDNKVTKRAEGNQRDGGPSSSSGDGFTATAGSRKRDGFGRMKELGKKYLCIMPF